MKMIGRFAPGCRHAQLCILDFLFLVCSFRAKTAAHRGTVCFQFMVRHLTHLKVFS